MRRTCALLLALAPLAPAAGRPVTPPHSEAFRSLLECRAIADGAARLSCFDAAAAALQTAEARQDVVVVDRAQIVKTRKQLFGFALPSLEIFGHDKGDAKDDGQLSEISSPIVAVGRNADGGWVLTLEDGARWSQTDDVVLGRTPKVGMVATIHRAALGSYKMNVGNGPGMRAKRLN